jgi:hypothetical protein
VDWLKLASGAGDIIKKSADQACGSACNTTSLGALFGQITNALIFVVCNCQW